MIDEHIKRPWPPEVLEAAALFKLGDVIERPPFFYARHPTLELFDSSGAAEGESQVAELHPEDAPPYAIITTQTCDVDERGVPEQPWIQASPVYPLAGDAPPNRAYLVELTGALPGRHVADLRIELPLEKTLLVGRQPIAGFATEEEGEAFARRLGVRRARAALADELVETVTALLGKRKANNKRRSRRVWPKLWRIGLQIEKGTRLRPVAVRLHVMSAGPPSDDVKAWFADWEDVARLNAAEVSITVHTTRHHDATQMDARVAASLVILDV